MGVFEDFADNLKEMVTRRYAQGQRFETEHVVIFDGGELVAISMERAIPPFISALGRGAQREAQVAATRFLMDKTGGDIFGVLSEAWTVDHTKLPTDAAGMKKEMDWIAEHGVRQHKDACEVAMMFVYHKDGSHCLRTWKIIYDFQRVPHLGKQLTDLGGTEGGDAKVESFWAGVFGKRPDMNAVRDRIVNNMKEADR